MRQTFVTRDQIIATLLLPFIMAIIALLFVPVVLCQGRPFFYRSERMRDADTRFTLLKIRTMRPSRGTKDTPLGGYNEDRVTPIGRFLRRTRLDELPQILNVMRGDIGFVGPRPPTPRHVAARPLQYRQLLSRCRPGITGLATVVVHRREERLLSRCRSAAETETVYLRRCLPAKLRLDMIYARNRSLLLDARIIWRTFSGLQFREQDHGARRPIPLMHQNASSLPQSEIAQLRSA